MIVLMTLITGHCLSARHDRASRKSLFPHQANGSLIEQNGKVIGSELIGQNFAERQIFPWPPFGRGQWLRRRQFVRLQSRPDLQDADRPRRRPMPQSCRRKIPARRCRSISSPPRPAASTRTSRRPPPCFQVPRVAKARGLSEDAVRQLVRAHVEGRVLGVIGEPHVNVLKLNLALDAMQRGLRLECAPDTGHHWRMTDDRPDDTPIARSAARSRRRRKAAAG